MWAGLTARDMIMKEFSWVFQLQLCNALFIHLPIDKSLGCFRFKAIMKKKKKRCYQRLHTNLYVDMYLHFFWVNK